MVPISVVEINGQSPGTLNYTDHNEPGLSVIPICGFLLSLGLTLAGVTISYFLRNPMMYDPPPSCKWADGSDTDTITRLCAVFGCRRRLRAGMLTSRSRSNCFWMSFEAWRLRVRPQRIQAKGSKSPGQPDRDHTKQDGFRRAAGRQHQPRH